MLASLIVAEQTWILMSVILAGVAVSIHLEQRYRWAARLSGPVLGLLIAMTLSTTGVMPSGVLDSTKRVAAYEFVSDFLMPTAIPLLLFQANVLRIIRTTGKMFAAFHVSVFGTIAGAAVATVVMSGALAHPAEIGGIMTASYSGGSVNFFAVIASFRPIVKSEEIVPLIVADNFVMAGMFMVLLLLSGSRFLLRRFPHPAIRDADLEESAAAAREHWAARPVGLRDVSTALALAVAITMVARLCAHGTGAHFDEGSLGRAILGNLFVWITLLSLAVATLFHRPLERVGGADTLGGYLLYIYLFTIGLPADLVVVLKKAPQMFAYCGIMAVVNLAVTLALGKLLRLNLEDLLLSVNATLGGAPSAVAMAISKGWPKLVLPAMLVGIWGYVIGTATGIAVARLLANLLP